MPALNSPGLGLRRLGQRRLALPGPAFPRIDGMGGRLLSSAGPHPCCCCCCCSLSLSPSTPSALPSASSRLVTILRTSRSSESTEIARLLYLAATAPWGSHATTLKLAYPPSARATSARAFISARIASAARSSIVIGTATLDTVPLQSLRPTMLSCPPAASH